MKIINTEVFNFNGAIRGMRNAMNSWDRADSHYNPDGTFYIGENDMKLAQSLIGAGQASHRKFLRQISASFDVEAPIYWWKEMDTYKINTVRNSTSTMHKLATTPITRKCFSFDEELNEHYLRYYIDDLGKGLNFFDISISMCEHLRQVYLETKDINIWRQLIQLLPSGWNQMSTFTCNYENLRTIYFDRRNHKLKEWHIFCDWIESLPYAKELITYKKEDIEVST